jgi:hypothetical protein
MCILFNNKHLLSL